LTGLCRTTLWQPLLRSVAGSPQRSTAYISAVCLRAKPSNGRPACQNTCRYFPLIFSYCYYLGLLHSEPSFSGNNLFFRLFRYLGYCFLYGRKRTCCKICEFRLLQQLSVLVYPPYIHFRSL